MNVFGAFTFGSLIKTFLPGFVWLAALLLLWNDLAQATAALPLLPALTPTQEQSVLVLAIPVAILLGLLSNIVVFMGVNDKLVRNRFSQVERELYNLYQWLVVKLRSEYWDRLGCLETPLRGTFADHGDAEILILQTLGLTNLAYVREQYWYHLEFQINLLVATFALLVTILFSSYVREVPAAQLVWRAGLSIVVLGGVCWLLLVAARKNYRRHIGKMCSLMTAALYQDLKEVKAKAPTHEDTADSSARIQPESGLPLLLAGVGCAILGAACAKIRPSPRAGRF